MDRNVSTLIFFLWIMEVEIFNSRFKNTLIDNHLYDILIGKQTLTNTDTYIHRKKSKCWIDLNAF